MKRSAAQLSDQSARVLRRLGRTSAAALLVAGVLAGSGCSEGGALEENVIRPGITAIDQAAALACDQDASTLRAAAQQYQLLEGAPPANEAVLVNARYLRQESTMWDLTNGALVAVDPRCAGAVGEIGQIVTETLPPLDGEALLASFTEAQVAQVGGRECARELALIFAASERYVAEQAKQPTTLDDLVSAGYLSEPIKLWTATPEAVSPAAGSGCTDLAAIEAGGTVAAPPTSATTAATTAAAPGQPFTAVDCVRGATTLATAREAYLAANPGAAEPDQTVLVASEILRAPIDHLTFVDGRVAGTPGGPCEGVDLG